VDAYGMHICLVVMKYQSAYKWCYLKNGLTKNVKNRKVTPSLFDDKNVKITKIHKQISMLLKWKIKIIFTIIIEHGDKSYTIQQHKNFCPLGKQKRKLNQKSLK
jgi:hypothetical protein